MRSQRVGILGGTFNPPHIGHLILAQEILDKFNLDKIFFIPTNIPPHKNTALIDARHRLIMTEMSVQENKKFSCLDLEIKRGGISYTIDTIRELKRKFPKNDFYLIIGSDLAKDFHTWKSYREIAGLTRIVVGKRDKFPIRKRGGFFLVDILQVEVSSSLIREFIKKNFSIKYLVHPDVEKYIKKHKLYL